MILNATDRDRFEAVLSRDASEIRPKLCLLVRRNQVAPPLGRKHDVDEIRNVGM
jgi:hypothetical protein